MPAATPSRGAATVVRSRPRSACGARGEEPAKPGLSRCELLYHQAIFASRESAQLEEEIKILKQREEMRECTFRPKLLPSRRTSSPRPQPRNFETAVARMRSAHRSRVRQHEEKQRIPCGENYERLRRLGTRPFSWYFRDKMGERTQPRQQPIVYVEVNVGRGRTGRIGVREGDDIHVLSRNFAKAFQLDQETTQKLEEMLEEAYEQRIRETYPEDEGDLDDESHRVLEEALAEAEAGDRRPSSRPPTPSSEGRGGAIQAEASVELREDEVAAAESGL